LSDSWQTSGAPAAQPTTNHRAATTAAIARDTPVPTIAYSIMFAPDPSGKIRLIVSIAVSDH
jgi:hypothetical protein